MHALPPPSQRVASERACWELGFSLLLSSPHEEIGEATWGSWTCTPMGGNRVSKDLGRPRRELALPPIHASVASEAICGIDSHHCPGGSKESPSSTGRLRGQERGDLPIIWSFRTLKMFWFHLKVIPPTKNQCELDMNERTQSTDADTKPAQCPRRAELTAVIIEVIQGRRWVLQSHQVECPHPTLECLSDSPTLALDGFQIPRGHEDQH